MLLEELYGIDSLTILQRQISARIRELLIPIDERLIDGHRTVMWVKHGAGKYFLEMILAAAAPDSFVIQVEINDDNALIYLDGLPNTWVYDPDTTPDDPAIQHLIQTLRNIFAGQIKIIEERAAGRPFRWTRYDLVNDEWVAGKTKQALLYNFFGQRSSVEKFCLLQ